MSLNNLLESITLAPHDIVFEVNQQYQRDTSPLKINCSIGAYRDNEGESFTFSAIRSAEALLMNGKLSHDYLPLEGLTDLFRPTQELVFSSTSMSYLEKRIASIQTLSGTGAISLAGIFAKRFLSARIAYVSSPSWSNHVPLLENLDYEVRRYPYWTHEEQHLCINQMIDTLNEAPENSLIVLQVCGHNPTGIDPTHKEWEAIRDVVLKRHLIPLFDNAYQGCCSGDVDEDAYPIRLFDSINVPIIVAQSFAKNMGLYGQRIGMLHITLPSPEVVPRVMSRLKEITRRLYSSPPCFGAYLVNIVLNSDTLKRQWLDELKNVFAQRLKWIRQELFAGFTLQRIRGSWEFLLAQRGLFFLTNLCPKQCDRLARQYHIYILPSGRVSIAGLNKRNIEYFISSMKKVIDEKENV